MVIPEIFYSLPSPPPPARKQYFWGEDYVATEMFHV
jgi:hypothetical protein